MAEAFVITLYKTVDLVSGELKVVQLDTSITALWLRKFDDAGTYTTQYSLTNLGNAKFLAEVPDGRYQLWKSSYPDATAENRMDFWHGGDAKFRWVSDKDMAYIPASSLSSLVDIASVQTVTGAKTFNHIVISQLRADLSAAGYEITGLIDPTVNSAAARKGYVDAQDLATIEAMKLIFPQMTDGALDQNIYATWTFRDAGAIPYILATPTSPFHAANVKFVKDWVNNYLTGQITFQQTETIIIIDFDCTQENNRRYFSITGAIAAANGYADVGTRMTLYVEGGNVDNLIANGNLAYMLFPETAADYVDLVGMSQQVWVTLSDAAYSTATVGKKVIQNITLSNPGSSSTTFSKYVFRNVKFIGAAAGSNIAFTDCIFENCSKDSTVTVTYSNCLGEIFDISNSQKLLFNTIKDEGGAYDVIFSNGDIQGKRILGRQGTDVVSANNITLGNGNAFVITGNTQVNLISSSGWTSGSVITLQFSGTPTVKHFYAPSGVYKAINWKSGADKVMTGGEVFMLVLSWDTNYWTEV